MAAHKRGEGPGGVVPGKQHLPQQNEGANHGLQEHAPIHNDGTAGDKL
jgi:hypothetical protein